MSSKQRCLPEDLIIWQATLLHIWGWVCRKQHNLIPKVPPGKLDQMSHVPLVINVPDKTVLILKLRRHTSL